MPWCPKCKAEFREGFTECNTCHIPLIDHRPDGTEHIPEPDPAEEKAQRKARRRQHLLRIVQTLIVILLALAAVFLLQNMGV
ncbi:hypothetical protein [Agathobaculum sp.]|uniref:hypothetical protein n=1 Tax=Agathobaculum sp. TaxID=2048138 RepID=UPI001C3AD665|nr:hypothetical protein [Agathobaculum sp.]HIX10086.1 hypothetical protein [Candidatus Agathobaculum pullistercoris]